MCVREGEGDIQYKYVFVCVCNGFRLRVSTTKFRLGHQVGIGQNQNFQFACYKTMIN